MAVTKAPLFGLDASGSLAGSIVFSKWRGRTYVRRLAIPANPRTVLQVGMRSVFKFITQAFGALTSNQKAAWDALAAPDNITQLNAQVRDAQTRARRNEGWRLGPSETPGTTPDAPTGLAATAQNKSVDLVWTRPVGNQGDYTVAIYMFTADTITGIIGELVEVLAVTRESTTIIGLTNGVEVFFEVRETNTDGEFGTLSTSDSATPTA